MGLDPRLVAEFRGRLNRSRETNQEAWNLSRRLVGPSNLQATLKQLAEAPGAFSLGPEVGALYLPRLHQRDKGLTLHCVERLRPGSTLGGRLHVGQDRLERLRHFPSADFHFRFWGDQDMFELETVKGLRPCYTIVTCHAPATPAFAYEPQRVSRSHIDAHIRQTTGNIRQDRAEDEEEL